MDLHTIRVSPESKFVAYIFQLAVVAKESSWDVDAEKEALCHVK
jgi:hypothetical protein